MADDGVIAAYLRELRFSVARLPNADDIVAEAEDHLLEVKVVERLTASDGETIEGAVRRVVAAKLMAAA